MNESPAPAAPAAPPASTPSAPADRTMAAVAYILTWITGLIIFFTAKKEDRYTRWHAIQAIGLGIVAFVVSWILNFFWTMMFFGVGGPMGVGMGMGMLASVWWLLIIVAVVVLAIKAYQGESVRLPVIADFADKNA